MTENLHLGWDLNQVSSFMHWCSTTKVPGHIPWTSCKSLPLSLSLQDPEKGEQSLHPMEEHQQVVMLLRGYLYHHFRWIPDDIKFPSIIKGIKSVNFSSEKSNKTCFSSGLDQSQLEVHYLVKDVQEWSPVNTNIIVYLSIKNP